MIKENLSYNDIKKICLYDGQNITMVLEQDRESVKSILDANASMRNHVKQTGDFWHVASLPMEVVVDLYNRGLKIGDKNDWPKIKYLLNTEYAYLKTIPGKI